MAETRDRVPSLGMAASREARHVRANVEGCGGLITPDCGELMVSACGEFMASDCGELMVSA